MPITTTLNSGDQVEIITAETAKPKPEWLEQAQTAKAKRAIKSFMKREQEHNYQRGMQMLEEALAKLNITPNNRVIRKLIAAYESNNKEELYTKIGAGIVTLDNLEKIVKTNSQNKILKFWKLFIKDDEDEGDDESTADEKKPLEEAELVVAECCHPLPGDSVVGFKDPLTHKIFVHKSTCDELNRLA
jgi:GTP pyrophosphokinase